MQLCVIHQQHCVMPSSLLSSGIFNVQWASPSRLLCCTVRASWWLSLVVPVWCGGTRRKWVRGNNSVPQASTIVTDYALPPPVSHGSWTTLIPEQRFKMHAEVVISLGKVKWSKSVVFFWFCWLEHQLSTLTNAMGCLARFLRHQAEARARSVAAKFQAILGFPAVILILRCGDEHERSVNSC